MIKTQILEPKYTQKEALVLLLHTDPSLDLQDIEDVYYPYVRFRYLLQIGKGRFTKKLNKLSDCIIDRISGTTYESSGDPYYEEVEIPEDEALEVEIPMHQCYDTGHTFVLKEYIGKAKLVSAPQMQIIEEDHFYKKFYVVTCRNKEGFTYYILVDSVDGGISVLDHEKHIEELAKEGYFEDAERALEYMGEEYDSEEKYDEEAEEEFDEELDEEYEIQVDSDADEKK